MNELFTPSAVLPDNEQTTATSASAVCEHCNIPFTPRSCSGGKPQRFCGTKCRAAFHSGAQRAQRSPTCSNVGQSPAVIQPKEESASAATARDFDEGFDWSNDEDIVLREQQSIAIYRNKFDDLVIRRERHWDEEDDTVIVITHENIDHFLDKLTDACGIPSFGGPEPKSGKRD